MGHTCRTAGLGIAIAIAAIIAIIFRKTGVVQNLRTSLSGLNQVGDVFQRSTEEYQPLPVWVLTGFLGSGKTTLVNRLVRADLGFSNLLVIENEAGDTRLDAELVVQASGRPENVLLVNDGCACCSVRGDLCDLLRDEVLARRAGKIDGVIIECSGLADPRAVVQTFLLDDDLKRRLQLREVVAVVDATNVSRHLQLVGACARTPLTRLVEEQIAFSSLILLNKVDGLRGCQVGDLAHSIREVNRTAEIINCSFCDVDLSRILGGAGFREPLGAWSPDRALLDIERLHLEIGSDAAAARADTAEHTPGVKQPAQNDEAVRCISVRIHGNLDLDAFNRWVLRSLADFDILRAKGVLAVARRDEKLAFQAVHAAFNGTPALDSRWRPGEARFSEVVVIGCGLRPQLLEVGLRRCLT